MQRFKRIGQTFSLTLACLVMVILIAVIILSIVGGQDILYIYAKPEEAIAGAKVDTSIGLFINEKENALTSFECQNKSNSSIECTWKTKQENSNAEVIIRTKKSLSNQSYIHCSVKVVEKREDLVITEFENIIPDPPS